MSPTSYQAAPPRVTSKDYMERLLGSQGNFGKVNSEYRILDRFRKTMVLVQADDSGWRRDAGGGRLETGDLRRETGGLRLETGDWRRETGDWI